MSPPPPLSYTPLHYYPQGALPLLGTHVYLGQLHPSLVLHRRLSLLADDVVVVELIVELRSRVYDL